MNYVSDYTQNKYAYLSATHKRTIVNAIISDGTKSSKVKGSGILGDLNIWSFYNEMENETLSNSVTYAMENLSSSYSYEPIDSTDNVNLSMSYKNCGFMVDSDKLIKAKFTPEKSVAVNNNGGITTLKMTLNDGYYELPWYTIGVNTNHSKEISLTKHDDGFLVDGDNLKEITITGNNDTETKELTFTTTENKVLIGENDNELTVSIDKDKDGVYETVIADSKNSKKSAELANLETENFKLSPAFAPAVRDYNSSVDYSVSKVALIPTLENGTTATISINNSAPVDFNGKQSVDLSVGKNTIKIVVSADNLESSTYTITVNRSQSSAMKSPNTGNNLFNLVIPIVAALTLSGATAVVYIVNKRKKKFHE